MNLKLVIKDILNYILLKRGLFFNRVVQKQLLDFKTIPIIIINYNQLYYLKLQIDFYLNRGYTNIIVIDNNSSYKPLLKFYEEYKEVIKIEKLKNNYGHKVLFESNELLLKYCQGFFALTDADILPNVNLPVDFMKILVNKLISYKGRFLKIGYALDLETIPDNYPLKEKVLRWESRFWKNEIERDVFEASIDTTFSVYLPKYPLVNYKLDFFNGIRIAGDFTAQHGGWYIDYENMTDEQLYYQNTATTSSSWLKDKDGKLNNEFGNFYG